MDRYSRNIQESARRRTGTFVGVVTDQRRDGALTNASTRMQPLFSVGRIVESPKVESADSQIRENYGHTLAHKNSGACPGQMRFVSAKKVHRARHEAVAETSATSPIDENSKVLGQNRPVHDAVQRVFKFGERVRIGEHQFCSRSVREYDPRHRHASFIRQDAAGTTNGATPDVPLPARMCLCLQRERADSSCENRPVKIGRETGLEPATPDPQGSGASPHVAFYRGISSPLAPSHRRS